MKISVSNFNPYERFGLGVFETMPYLNGDIPFLEEHLNRLQNGLQTLNSPSVQISCEDILNAVSKELASAKGVVRLLAYMDSNFELNVSPGIPYKDTDYQQGFSLKLADGFKNEYSPYFKIKHLNYLENFLARNIAKEEGFNDAIFLNTKGNIAETSSANIFILRNKKLYTPPIADGILPGIIRSYVIKYAINEGWEVYEKGLNIEELLNAEHVFLTNSLLCIMPVARVANHTILRDRSFEAGFCSSFAAKYGYIR